MLIFDRNGLQFPPFKAHPTAMIQHLEQPEELAGWFDALQGEVNRRFRFLAETGAENRALAPASKALRLLAVVDDFSILGDTLDVAERRALWLAARRLAADSRKSGIHLALAVQNPTWQSIDLGIRRNCRPLTFRVNDGDASRDILNTPGAEALGKQKGFVTQSRVVRTAGHQHTLDIAQFNRGNDLLRHFCGFDFLDGVAEGRVVDLGFIPTQKGPNRPEVTVNAARIVPVLLKLNQEAADQIGINGFDAFDTTPCAKAGKCLRSLALENESFVCAALSALRVQKSFLPPGQSRSGKNEKCRPRKSPLLFANIYFGFGAVGKPAPAGRRPTME